VFTPKILPYFPSKGTNKNKSFEIVFKNIIETFSNPMDFENFKEIVLGA